jgi:hypothetical protein
MSVQAVLAPVFVQVALTFALLFATGGARLRAIRSKEVRVGDIALGQRVWPAKVQQISNAYQNQFELPVLFYALVAFALITRQADMVFVLMAWVFVLTRLAHAFVHVTTNRIDRRFQIFVAGTMILMSMWAIFAVRLLIGAVA